MPTDITELSHDASRICQDIVQLHDGYVQAVRRAESYRGGMRWKTVNGTDYLYRGTDRRGNARSLGRRSPETEKKIEDYNAGKVRAKNALEEIEIRLQEYARFAKAAKINRLPDELAKVLRAVELVDLGNRTLIVGTNCIYAYEVGAGVRVLTAALATLDVDILYDGRVKTSLIVEDIERLYSAILAADDNYSVASKLPYRLTNGKYMIDLICPKQPAVKASVQVRGLSLAEVEGLEWLVNSPKMEQVVVARDGRSASMCVPIPEAFAGHKLWLSGRRDRDPIKKKRDRLQAEVTTEILQNHLGKEIGMDALRAFPRKVAESYIKFAADLAD